MPVMFSWQALFLLGLMGSLGHCLGMCGPLVLMVGSRSAAENHTPIVIRLLFYNSARILVYGCLGVIAGLAGQALGQDSQLSGIAGIVSLILGILVILFAASYAGWIRMGALQSGAGWWNRMMSRAMAWPGAGGDIALGALNGLLPCGLVYSALSASVSAGSALGGGLAMLVFGIGTVPVLVALGLGARFISTSLRHIVARLAFVLAATVGVQLILRGLAALGLVAHLRLGSVMLW